MTGRQLGKKSLEKEQTIRINQKKIIQESLGRLNNMKRNREFVRQGNKKQLQIASNNFHTKFMTQNNRNRETENS